MTKMKMSHPHEKLEDEHPPTGQPLNNISISHNEFRYADNHSLTLSYLFIATK